ncbi:MAG: NB-ARC domain-containing protein [Microcoleaceae cyanobacterium]
MITQIPPDFINAIAKEHRVTDAELETVFMALEGRSTTAIAQQLEISDIAVRKRLGEVYKKFEIKGNGPGKLAALKHQLLFLYQTTQNSALGITPISLSSAAILRHQQDWGEAPEISVFYGRNQELETLKQWIISDNCPLVTLWGLPGIGKTTLGVKLANILKEEFDLILWRSRRNPQSPDQFITHLIQTIIHHFPGQITKNSSDQLSELIELLRHYKIFLIFDDWENVLKPKKISGEYREGYHDYGNLIKQIALVNHQSSLLLISSEIPPEISFLNGDKVRLMQPHVSEEIPLAIFQNKGLSASSKEWKTLINLYGGNILAFQIISGKIADFFNGNVLDFIEAPDIFLDNPLTSLLLQQLQRLSAAEEEILYWCVIENIPISLRQLQGNLLLQYPFSALLNILDSLKARSLLERQRENGETLFILPPLINKYVTNLLIEKVGAEIDNLIQTEKMESLLLLKTHRLFTRNLEKETKTPPKNHLGDLIKNHIEAILIKNTDYEKSRKTLTKIAESLVNKSPREVRYARENLQILISELTH